MILRMIAVMVLLAGVSVGQTTNTDCMVSGNHATCTSRPSAYDQGYNAGLPLGQALGNGIGAALARHNSPEARAAREVKQQRDFCAKNPGQAYKGQTCGSLLDQVKGVYSAWTWNHPKYRLTNENALAMLNYISDNHLNPLNPGSYDHAFRMLKHDHNIEVNN